MAWAAASAQRKTTTMRARLVERVAHGERRPRQAVHRRFERLPHARPRGWARSPLAPHLPASAFTRCFTTRERPLLAWQSTEQPSQALARSVMGSIAASRL